MNTSKIIAATFTRKPSFVLHSPFGGFFEDGFRFTVKGEFGQAYQIDASTNLVEWQPLTTITNVYGTTQFTDESATNTPRRFYRAAALPTNMALIPAGSFTMGDTLSEGGSHELPVRTVYVSAFYMDKYEVTKALWDDVYQWATNHNYSFDYNDSGQGKANDHPAQEMTWYDCVKWCNARSEKEGRMPAYYTDAAQSVVYRSGTNDLVSAWVNWNSGYRLPTEAEWEKAAHGGASGHRFPWSDADNITHGLANYYSTNTYAYDSSLTRGYHPTFATGDEPYTSPAGYFAANGYGLYDMAGNVWEWCWDWYWAYSSGSQTDPRGPTSGKTRVARGGSWYANAFKCRVTWRAVDNPPHRGDGVGFRCVLPPSQ
jgi:formylglycine-generating enzyme required for sulfatase activity